MIVLFFIPQIFDNYSVEGQTYSDRDNELFNSNNPQFKWMSFSSWKSKNCSMKLKFYTGCCSSDSTDKSYGFKAYLRFLTGLILFISICYLFCS